MSERIRVAYVLNDGGGNWLGGVNYIVNLLRVASRQSSIEPVLLTRAGLPAAFSEFASSEQHASRLVAPTGLVQIVQKGLAGLVGRDLVFEQLLRRHRIDVLSHSGILGRRSPVPAVAWIPDFQHEHLPQFFSAQDRARRRTMYGRVAAEAQTVVLSSQHAEADFHRLYPRAPARTAVLRFVADTSRALHAVPGRARLTEAYGLAEPYFHLPNQFWIHKNHGVVIDALARIRAWGRRATVIATGHTGDARHPEHFAQLMARAGDAGCAEDFRVLGVVPYAELTALMVHSVALINPSRFEGWSTTVEEGKSLGKQLLLSDIPVHREQAPRYGTYFGCDDPDTLARAMLDHLDRFDPGAERARQAEANAELPARLEKFGQTLATILRDTVAGQG